MLVSLMLYAVAGFGVTDHASGEASKPSDTSVHKAIVDVSAFSALGLPPAAAEGAETASRQATADRGSSVQTRPWTAATTVEMRQFSVVPDGTSHPVAVKASPDARYFFVMSYRGDLADDSIVQRIDVYDAAAVAKWVRSPRGAVDQIAPVRSVEKRTRETIAPSAIASARWSSNSSAILFIGEDSDGIDQIYSFDIVSGRLKALSNDRSAKFFLQTGGAGAIWRRSVVEAAVPSSTEPIIPAPRNEAGEIQIPFFPPVQRKNEWLASYDGEEPWVLPIDRAVQLHTWFSPEGDRAVISPVGNQARTFLLVNMKNRQITPLKAPASGDRQADVHVVWNGKASDPVVTYQIPVEPKSTAKAPPVEIILEQDANRPPQLVARAGPRSRTLSKPDPALGNVDISVTKPYSWSLPDGTEITGGLTLPRRSSDTPPPLVVNVTSLNSAGYRNDAFVPEGAIPTAMSRLSLVAQGFAVLDLNFKDRASLGTPEEGRDFISTLDHIINDMAERKIIDRDSVGLVGVGRGGYHALYALTHQGKSPIKAAIVVDSNNMSYLPYLLSGATGAGSRSYENINGGSFWKNKERWSSQDIVMNMSKITAPVLFIEYFQPSENQLTTLDVSGSTLSNITALSSNKKAFDYIFFPNVHGQLYGPRQRQAGLQIANDWMRLWLAKGDWRSETEGDHIARWVRMRGTHSRQIQQ